MHQLWKFHGCVCESTRNKNYRLRAENEEKASSDTARGWRSSGPRRGSCWGEGKRLLLRREDSRDLQTREAQSACWGSGKQSLLLSATCGQTAEKEETFNWFLVYHRDHTLGTCQFSVAGDWSRPVRTPCSCRTRGLSHGPGSPDLPGANSSTQAWSREGLGTATPRRPSVGPRNHRGSAEGRQAARGTTEGQAWGTASLPGDGDLTRGSVLGFSPI